MRGTMIRSRTIAMAAVVAMALCAGLAHAAKDFAGVVNINTANLEQLTELPGIGPAKAQAIVAYRTEKPFKSIEEIKEVKGIGDKLFAKLETYLTVSGETMVGPSGTKPGSGAKAN